MPMFPQRAKFISDLVELWEVTQPDSYRDTCDLIEAFWKDARVAGFEAAASPIFTPGITYGPMLPLANSSGTATAETAAIAIESGVYQMVFSSILMVTPPAVATLPPVPLTAFPGTLLGPLIGIFKGGAKGKATASLVGNAIANYLAGWQLNVVIPPAASSPIPII